MNCDDVEEEEWNKAEGKKKGGGIGLEIEMEWNGG